MSSEIIINIADARPEISINLVDAKPEIIANITASGPRGEKGEKGEVGDTVAMTAEELRHIIMGV